MDPDTIPQPFAAGELVTVAEEFDVDPSRLADLVAGHQELMGKLPGVENLVYEWRKQFDATVLVRTDRWYFVAAPEWAWGEFADVLDATDAEESALAAVHARTVATRSDVTDDRIEATTPLVLLRD